MAQKPSIPKGTRDFSPAEMAKRNYIFDTIKTVFALHGFRQIETPALENLSTLMGKYGEEGDKLLFKVLNSGDFLKNVADEQLQERNCPPTCHNALRERASLRFDSAVCSVCRTASERIAIPVQKIPNTTGVACRPSAKRAVSRILSM